MLQREIDRRAKLHGPAGPPPTQADIADWEARMKALAPTEMLHKNYMEKRPDVRNRAEMTKHRNDVSRQVLADEEEKLAPKYSQPLQAHTD